MKAGDTVTVRNKRTGVESPMTREQWEKTNADPQWAGVFSVKEAPEPPEVTELNNRKKATKAEADKSADGK